MDRADEIIPFMPGSEVLDPRFVAGDEIDFERELDRQVRELTPGLVDLLDLGIEVGQPHPPIIKAILGHGVVIGEPDLRQPDGYSLRGQFHRFPGGVETERRVHVIIRRQRHA